MKDKSNNTDQEGNKYDKIFKENANPIFLKLVEWQLNFKIKDYKRLEPKLQTTLEREMDSLFEVETDKGEVFILHIEFQSKNDPKMLLRMAEYHGIILKLYAKPIRHLVIYLGRYKANMTNQLPASMQFTGFDLLSIRELDYQILLSSQVPEVIMLAILSKYPKNQSEQILRATLDQLRHSSPNINELKRYVKQLTMISKLRKLDNKTIKIITDMPIDIDVTTSYLYKLGAKEERRKIKKELREERKKIKEEAKEEVKEAKEEVKEAKEEIKEAKEGVKEAKEEVKEAKEEVKEIKNQMDHAILHAISLDLLPLDQIAQMFNVPFSYIEKLMDENKNLDTK